MIKRADRLVVISGPSGVGKTTIVRRVLKKTGAEFSVSATTRPRRPNEIDGRDYRFVDRKTFQDMVQQGQMLEWAEVFGQFYGTPAKPVRDAIAAGKTVLLDIDVQGALQVHRQMPGATFILVLPPNQDKLVERLHRRASEAGPDMARRLGQAKQEIKAAVQSGVYNYWVVNDKLEKTVSQVVGIITQERSKR